MCFLQCEGDIIGIFFVTLSHCSSNGDETIFQGRRTYFCDLQGVDASDKPFTAFFS